MLPITRPEAIPGGRLEPGGHIRAKYGAALIGARAGLLGRIAQLAREPVEPIVRPKPEFGPRHPSRLRVHCGGAGRLLAILGRAVLWRDEDLLGHAAVDRAEAVDRKGRAARAPLLAKRAVAVVRARTGRARRLSRPHPRLRAKLPLGRRGLAAVGLVAARAVNLVARAGRARDGRRELRPHEELGRVVPGAAAEAVSGRRPPVGRGLRAEHRLGVHRGLTERHCGRSRRVGRGTGRRE